MKGGGREAGGCVRVGAALERLANPTHAPPPRPQTINQVLPQNLFAISIIPYAGFLYSLTKSRQAPPLALFGFYFLLVFVFATIPAGIYGAQADSTRAPLACTR